MSDAPSQGASLAPRRKFVASICLTITVVLPAWNSAHAQINLAELNPTRSTLDAVSPNAGSGGRVNHLAGDPSNSNIYYAASEWGGLYKSPDRGDTWARIDQHLPTVVWDVAVNPANANRLYVTSFYDGRVSSRAGINVSTDGGRSWVHPDVAVPPGAFCRDAARLREPSAFGIGIEPDSAHNIYIGTNCGLAISNDSGATWRLVDPTPATGASDVWDVVAHDKGIVDLCGDDGHLRSLDGGATWATAGPGAIPLLRGRCSLAVSPDEPYVIFAAVGKQQIFESDNGGGSWATQYATPEPIPQGRITFVKTNRRMGSGYDLWFGDVGLFRASCATPATPAVGGAARCPASSSWVGPRTPQARKATGAHDDMGDIVFDTRRTLTTDPTCLEPCEGRRNQCMSRVGQPGAALARECAQQYTQCIARCTRVAADACPVLLSSDGGIYINTVRTVPRCQTPIWEQPSVTPRGLWLFGMAGADRASPNAEYLYTATQDNGTFSTMDAGAASPAWDNRDVGDAFDVVAAPGQVLYTRCCFTLPATIRLNQLWLRNAGMTGGDSLNNYPAGTVPRPTTAGNGGAIDVISRFGMNGYAVVTSVGVFVTTDITATPINWIQLGAATNPVNACGVRAVGPAANPTFYVQAGVCSGFAQDQLWRHVGASAGGAWQQVNPPGGVGGFGTFAVHPSNAQRLLASVLTAATGPQMMDSNDGGANWVRNSNLDNRMTGAGVFRYQNTRGPTNSTGFGGYAQPTLVAFSPNQTGTIVAGGVDSGIFLSTDDGASWTIVTNNSGPPSNPHIPRPWFAYFDREGGAFNVYIGSQGRGVWRMRYPDPPGAARIACEEDCKQDRDDCMARVSQPGGPRPQQCVTMYRACVARCQRP